MLHKYTGDSQRKPPGHSGLHQFQSSGVCEIHTSLVRGEICIQEDTQISSFPPFPLLATRISPTVKFKEVSAEVIISIHEDSASGSDKSKCQARNSYEPA